MRIWTQEARFGPQFRQRAPRIYNRFVELLTNCSLTLSALETRTKEIESIAVHHHIIFTFNNRPGFRGAMRSLALQIGVTLQSFANWLCFEKKGQMLYYSLVEEQLTALKLSQNKMNEEYNAARKAIYYGDRCVETAAGGFEVKKAVQDVFLELNSFLFLLDTACRHMYAFWDEQIRSQQEAPLSSWRVFRAMFTELVPSQRALFNCNCNRNGDSGSWDVITQRLRQSCSVSVAILLAGVYGFYAKFTDQPALAAFTIAYVSGGSVVGLNILTSISRSVGTVVASIYAIIVLHIVGGLSSQSRY